MKNRSKTLKILFVLAFISLIAGLAVIAIAEPIAFKKANAVYTAGQWSWYNEYRSFIYETVSTNIKTIGMILSVIGAIGITVGPLITYFKSDKELE